MKLSDYIEKLLAEGRCTFTVDEAKQNLEKSRAAIILSIEHLKQQRKVASPAKGFYVIIPPEYRIYECLPAEYFLPYLMRYWQKQYYVCLVTAASYHGAAHQQPQTFQVMVQQSRKPITCGKIRVEFIANKHLKRNLTQKFITQRSELVVSTPEVTAMDLINYPKQCGGLNRIATILDELREAIKEKELLELLERATHRFWQQRLGYMLDKLGAGNLAQVIFQHLQQLSGIGYIPLDPLLPTNIPFSAKNKRWKIVENCSFESDL